MPSKKKTTRPPKAKLGDVVCVTWLDAWTETTEETVEQMSDTCIVTTTGELVRLEENIVSVGPEVVDYGTTGKKFRGCTHIPRAIVKDIKVLEAR